MKTWGEIRNSVLNLGFEKEKAWEKNRQGYVDAYNRAVNFIAATVAPPVEVLTIIKKEKGFMTVDLHKLAEKENRIFSHIARTGILCADGCRIADSNVTDNRFLTLGENITGEIKVYYSCIPPVITTAAEDYTPCPLEDKWANILPYLMANRLYLDDDRGKAAYYWNLFDDMKNSILAARSPPAVTVNGGVNIDVF